MQIKNKLTVTRGEEEEGNGVMKRKSQGACIKDTWAKSMWGSIECGRWGKVGWERVMVESNEETVTEQLLTKNIYNKRKEKEKKG